MLCTPSFQRLAAALAPAWALPAPAAAQEPPPGRVLTPSSLEGLMQVEVATGGPIPREAVPGGTHAVQQASFPGPGWSR
jgi:hypothetical protein